MNHSREPDVPHELADVAARLRAERPELTPLELDALQRRTITRLDRSRHPLRRYHAIMKSRLAVTSVLACGLLFSTTGAGLAITGSSSNASIAQYGESYPNGVVGGVVNTNTPSHRSTPSRGTTTPSEPSNAQSSPAQPIRQVEATGSGSSLPFTGLAAIPILVGGLVLLALGLALRRSSRHPA